MTIEQIRWVPRRVSCPSFLEGKSHLSAFFPLSIIQPPQAQREPTFKKRIVNKGHVTEVDEASRAPRLGLRQIQVFERL